MRVRELTSGRLTGSYDKADLQKFEAAIWHNRLQTMDEFLEEHPRFRRIGARIVADVVASCETESGLFKAFDWYTTFFDELRLRMANGPDLSQLAIVTFNYDRSLEHYIADNILHNCPESRQAYARDMWARVQIIHPHGSIGEYPQVNYGRALEAENFEQAAKGLRMLTDKLDELPAFKDAQRLVATAERIVFIGFGYNTRTLDSLFASNVTKEKEIYGTCYQMPQERISAVMSYFKDEMLFANPTLTAQSFMEALSKGPADRSLFSGLDAMQKAKPNSP